MRLAVVLFNLGGPDSMAAVRPFLFNLFKDPAIIGAPGLLRWALAHFISWRRAPVARRIYAQLGGASPLLENTQAQAEALAQLLNPASPSPDTQTKIFISMRYWRPFSDETARRVADFNPDGIVLLPLYPQFSTTTTGSSLKDWQRAAEEAGIDAPTTALCCYPTQPGLIAAMAAAIAPLLDEAATTKKAPRLLLSAHGLPRKIVAGGDPYQWQVEQTAAAVVRALDRPGLDWALCYQSRVGPLEWIGPATEDEILRAGKDGVPVVMAPVAFVSEHSETLVELDLEYREQAEKAGVPLYLRASTVGVDADFIAGLAALVGEAAAAAPGLYPPQDERICPNELGGCACAAIAALTGEE